MTVVEGEVVGQGETALAAVSRDNGVLALALMSDSDFEARLDALKRGQDRIRRIQRELMVEGEDYGVIPGTKKPTLLKPGAEKLCNVYGLVGTYEEEWIEGDGEARPHLRVRMRCLLRRGSETGPVVAVGVGAANSWERKHRWRRGERTCPRCGVEGSILRNKQADDRGDRGWFCWNKKGGCGAEFYSDAAEITAQQVGEVENKDPYDTENTLFKMGKKRSYIDATLNATATSGLFAQDLEDLPEGGGDEPRAEREQAPTPERRESPPPARQGTAQSEPAPERRNARPSGRQGALPRWNGPCPRCKAVGAVMVSKKDPGEYYCFPGSTRAKGCGYTFKPKDAEMHASAAANRGDLSDYGVSE